MYSQNPSLIVIHLFFSRFFYHYNIILFYFYFIFFPAVLHLSLEFLFLTVDLLAMLWIAIQVISTFFFLPFLFVSHLFHIFYLFFAIYMVSSVRL
ncbi:hypothetical protein BDZ91DRAFT_286449 [Kalaharituber pfeilii]|nr:hypothetical protein BDZ91DRAFT_286449 [Kalaharituber pfeilii]